MDREMNILEIIQALVKRFFTLLKVILFFAVVGGGLSLILNNKEYTSTSSLMVGGEVQKETGEFNEINGEPITEAEIEYGNSSISAQEDNFYTETIMRRDVLEEVIENLKLNISVEEFREIITIKVPEQSSSILVTVASPQLENVDQIAAELVNTFSDRIYEITDTEKVKVIDNATEPKVVNSVNIVKNTVIAIVVGLVVGIVIVLILEYLDDSIESKREIERKINLLVIGELESEETLIEDLKKIRTNLEYSPKLKDKKTIILTAPDLNYKNITLELSNVLIETDKEVLLMDTDFRNPIFQEESDITNEFGLSNLLNGELGLDDSTQTYKKNSRILTAGSSLENPSEQLSSDRMKNILAEVREEFNYVILNGHPINEVTDTVVLSTMTDGVILIVEKNKTTMKELERIKNTLTEVEVDILGVILNKI